MTLEEIEKRYHYFWLSRVEDWDGNEIDNDFKWLISRVKELEEGIRKHRDLRKGWNIRFWQEDNDLYKLVEE